MINKQLQKEKDLLLGLAIQAKKNREVIKLLQEQDKILRAEILGEMSRLGLKTLTNEQVKISIAYVDNFDAGWFVSPNNPEGMAKWGEYVTSETVIKYKMNKKAQARLKKQHPEVYELHCDYKERLTLK